MDAKHAPYFGSDDLDRLDEEEICRRRTCYCKPDQEFCGKCKVCGKDGHVCHYPGPAPYTGCWCDEHYVKEYREQLEIIQMLEIEESYFNEGA